MYQMDGVFLSQAATQKEDPKFGFKTDYRLMQVKSTFIKPLFVIKRHDLYIIEWPLKTGFTALRQFGLI